MRKGKITIVLAAACALLVISIVGGYVLAETVCTPVRDLDCFECVGEGGCGGTTVLNDYGYPRGCYQYMNNCIGGCFKCEEGTYDSACMWTKDGADCCRLTGTNDECGRDVPGYCSGPYSTFDPACLNGCCCITGGTGEDDCYLCNCISCDEDP